MSKKSKTFTQVSEKEYNNVKKLQKAGLRISETAIVAKRSDVTISRMFHSNSYNEYKQSSPYQQAKTKALDAAETIFDVIDEAKNKGAMVITTHAAFIGFDDLFDFVKEASDNNVTVTFAPMGKE